MAHIPGPWTVGPVDVEAERMGALFRTVLANGEHLVTVEPWEDVSMGELIATARLIAAAPDLLAACKAAPDKLDEDHDNAGNDWADQGAAEVAEQLEAAIAKTIGARRG